MENNTGGSKPPLTKTEAHDCNEGGTKIKIIFEPLFGLDDEYFDEVQQPLPSDNFIIVLDDEESSSSHFQLQA